MHPTQRLGAALAEGLLRITASGDSVLMKPEAETFVRELHARVEQLAYLEHADALKTFSEPTT